MIRSPRTAPTPKKTSRHASIASVSITMIALRRDMGTQIIACRPNTIPGQLDLECEDDIEDAPGNMPGPPSAGLWAWNDYGSELSETAVVWRGAWRRLTSEEALELAAGRTPWGWL